MRPPSVSDATRVGAGRKPIAHGNRRDLFIGKPEPPEKARGGWGRGAGGWGRGGTGGLGRNLSGFRQNLRQAAEMLPDRIRKSYAVLDMPPHILARPGPETRAAPFPNRLDP